MKNWKYPFLPAILFACIFLFVYACAPKIKTGDPVPGSIGNWVSIEQGFTLKQQQKFWSTTQGTEFIPYNWLLHLEQANSTELFRAKDNVNRMGYIPLMATKSNPDGLPLGWVKGRNKETQKEWMGFTCAGCHTGSFSYNGANFITDGGPASADFGMFITGLIAAMKATADDDAKFARFAAKIVTNGKTNELRTELKSLTNTLTNRNALNIPPDPAGFGRLDAAGTIFNQLFSWDLGVPENAEITNAPVDYPAIWDAPHTDLVQWNGSVNNAGVGPPIRNLAEVLGVYLTFNYDRKQTGTHSDGSPKFGKGYLSSAQLAAQGKLERLLKKMTSPRWPAGNLPAIDTDKVKLGKVHYDALCSPCHLVLKDRTKSNRRIKAVQTKVVDVGTDALYKNNFNYRLLKKPTLTGKLAGTRKIMVGSNHAVFPDTITGGTKLVTNAGVGILLNHPSQAIIDGLESFSFLHDTVVWDPESYRARPLNGMWATGPYLHNGSVLNYWELLKPDSERMKTFRLGSREFDPVNVGFISDGSFILDTSIPGNSNAGHTGKAYGTMLADEQKWELIEYLKTL